MPVTLHHVDAFTDEPFRGNPAAVCLLSGPRDPGWMQAVGAEMNLPETAFVYPEAGELRLRWFTPAVEVDLCGHATLAAAHVLWETGRLAPDDLARFETRSGTLTATLHQVDAAGVAAGSRIELDFPATPAPRAEPPTALAEYLGVTPKFVGRSRFDWLVEVESEAIVRRVAPDLARLKSIPARGVIVTAAATTKGFDYVSRFFAPAAGVDEDPVTGSAHCALAPFWSQRLGRDELVGFQASARGGTVHTRLAGDRVRLGGRAVTVLRGELLG